MLILGGNNRLNLVPRVFTLACEVVIDYDSTFQITPGNHLSCNLIKIFRYPLCSCMNMTKLTIYCCQ